MFSRLLLIVVALGVSSVHAGTIFVDGNFLRNVDGNPRFVADAGAGAGGATVDMGAYEFQGASCDLSDMLTMLAAWGRCDDCGTCPWDLDGDCSVGILDLLILLADWTA